MTITALPHSLTRRLYTAQVDAFANAVAIARGVVNRYKTNDRIGDLHISGNRDQITVHASSKVAALWVDIPGTVDEPTNVDLNHYELAQVLKAATTGIPKRNRCTIPVSLSLEGETVIATVNGFSAPVTKYPESIQPERPERTATVRVDRIAFTEEITRINRIVPHSPSSVPILTGIELTVEHNRLSLAGTDNYRLLLGAVSARPVKPTKRPSAIVVDGATLASCVRGFTGDYVDLAIENRAEEVRLLVFCGNVTLSLTSFSESYPKYQRLLPHNAVSTAYLERNVMLTAARQAQMFLKAKEAKMKYVTLTLNPGTVTVTPFLQDDLILPLHLDATVTGQAQSHAITINACYLIDALSSFTSNFVTFHLQEDPKNPLVVTERPNGLADKSAFRHIVAAIHTGYIRH